MNWTNVGAIALLIVSVILLIWAVITYKEAAKELSKNAWLVNVSIWLSSLAAIIGIFTFVVARIPLEIPMKTNLTVSAAVFVWALLVSKMLKLVWLSVNYQERVIILNSFTGTTRTLKDGDHLLLLWEKVAIEPVSTAGTDLFHISCKKGDITYQSGDKIPFNAEWTRNVRVTNAVEYAKWSKTEIEDQIRSHDNQRVNDYCGNQPMDSIQGNAQGVMDFVKTWWEGVDGKKIQEMYGVELSDFVFSKIEQDERVRKAYAAAAATNTNAAAVRDYTKTVREVDTKFSGEAGQKGVIARETDGKGASLHDINIEVEGKDLPPGLTSLAVWPPIQQTPR